MSDPVSDPVSRLNAALEGSYTIERKLGEGGMAAVYLAEDIKHNRKVALKVLKPELAAVVGAERFLTEIQVTANLQHPHILPLHDSGEADSFLFYVMPYVEGESLRARLDRENQLPVDEAVKIATDLAEALDYAHRHGVIHRDIKPANILMHEGRPLIADFGIALAVGAAGGARLTETGLSVGTPFYMSPEQATGDQAVGPQTDTYALGSVLYEMLVGEPPYLGNTAQAVLGKIIAGKPVSATEQRSSIPGNVDAAVRCALEKLPADRFRSAQEFARALGDPHFRHGQFAVTGTESVAVSSWNRLTMAFAALAAFTTIGLGWVLLQPEPPAPLARFSSPFEEGQAPSGGGGPRFTPDGSAVLYVGPSESGAGTQLWLRRWAELDARPVRGTEGAATFTISPDGREVAFSGFPGPLRVVPLDGGPSRTVLDAVNVADDWTSDGMLYFSVGLAGNENDGIGRVPATGAGSAEVEILTEVLEGELTHTLFTALPGGKTGVFQSLRGANGENSEVWAVDLDTRALTFLTPGHTPSYASTGHLLFATPDGVLMAASIDPGTAELTGPSVPVLEGLAINAPFGTAAYAVSESGALIYLAGGVLEPGGGVIEATWMTRSGDAAPVEAGWRFDASTTDFGVRLSPDGERLALSPQVLNNVDIWIKQLPDGPLERLTYDDVTETDPFWSADGQFVTYVKNEDGNYDVWRRRADGAGTPELMLDDRRSLHQGTSSPDGEWMVFRTGGASGSVRTGESDIVGFRPGVDIEVVPLVATTNFAEHDPAISPDGRWLAYTSNETGRNEVYVRPFPDVDSNRAQVSRDGGFGPLWANGGDELFYVGAGEGSLIAARVETASSFRVLERETLFPLETAAIVGPGARLHDISPDDQRFLMIRLALGAGGAAGETRFILVENWFEEMRGRVGNQ